MEMQCNKVLELIQNGVLEPPMDGNHGEKHPKTDDYVSIGVPFILVPDLKDGIVDLDNCNFISEEQAKSLKKGFSKTGDVLFTHKATIGKVALVDTKQYNYIILTPQVTYYRVKNDNILSNRYLYYYFLSPTFQKIFRAFASSGGTRDYLGIEAQRKLPIFYPEIHKQERIADILSQYDNLIHNNNKRIKILEQMAENLYKEWFVRFRFPNYQNTESENGIPKGWKIVKLGELCDISTGKKDANEANGFGKYPFFTCARETNLYTDDYFLDTDSILIAGNGSYTGFVKKYSGKFDLYQRTYALYNFRDIEWLYLYWTMKSNFEKEFMGGSRGSAIPYITKPNLYKYKVLIPEKELLKKAKCFFEPIHKECCLLEQVNKNLTKQRDMLLPRLMSGKLEIK